ncbi:MAG: permease-like cell division protein FtsX, partial [Bacteroidetes bacterium]|nr:permease-like cell division protein FtsX [Bacteroidota bacterium]
INGKGKLAASPPAYPSRHHVLANACHSERSDESHEISRSVVIIYVKGSRNPSEIIIFTPEKLSMSTPEEKFNKRRLRTNYVSTVISISFVLLLVGLLGFILLHARKLSTQVREKIEVQVIIKDNIKEADILALQKSIDAAAYSKGTRYMTKEEAAEDFQKDLGEDFVNFLGHNPLMPSIILNVNAPYANNDSLKVIAQEIQKNSLVNEVSYKPIMIQKLNDNIENISFVLLGMSILLFLISFALINNTIRLLVYSKRLIIRSMQLVGATRSFIRRPFVLKGIMQGVVGSLLSLVLLALIIRFAESEEPDLVNFKEDIDLFLMLFSGVFAFGIILTWISTHFAVRKFLNLKIENLY